ncbi:MAG: 3'-5' exonuclease, partial [Chloroflexota bacterium]
MRGELVAIDLETTGLDSSTDEIIEIGAVRFRDGVVTDEFSVLVDPGRPIPTIVTSLTGLRDEDVIGKPKLLAVLPQLLAFVGDSVFVGHNVGFDAAFLRRQGILQNNLLVDTYE